MRTLHKLFHYELLFCVWFRHSSPHTGKKSLTNVLHLQSLKTSKNCSMDSFLWDVFWTNTGSKVAYVNLNQWWQSIVTFFTSFITSFIRWCSPCWLRRPWRCSWTLCCTGWGPWCRATSGARVRPMDQTVKWTIKKQCISDNIIFHIILTTIVQLHKTQRL